MGGYNAGTEPTSADQYSRACGGRLDLRHFPGTSVQWEGVVRPTGALLVGACGEPCPSLEPGVAGCSGLAHFAPAPPATGSGDELLLAQPRSEEHTSELQSPCNLV